MQKLMLILLSLVLLISLAGCGQANSENQQGANGGTEGNGDAKQAGEIYFLNFKPEIAEVYNQIAKDYEAETGVSVKVVTAASGTYETTLRSEIAKSDAPTIFQINGPIGYQTWKDYTRDLKDTELYQNLTDQGLAVTDGEGVYGIPYVVEGYGIIYNDAIMKNYFALTDRATDVSSMEEVNNFETLRAVVEDMTARKEELGIQGVFASTSLAAGEQWRWQTHLANIPFYYEFQENTEEGGNPTLTALNLDEIEFRYDENFRNIFDLYLNNSITKSTLLGSRSTADSMAEFALGQVAMVQNGNWAWSQINGVEGNVVAEEDIKFLPIYTGMEGEENQGLAIGTENYFAINNKVSEEKQQASIDFLEWLFTSDKGKDYVVNQLGFIAPFNTFNEDEQPADPLAREIISWLEKDTESIDWTFAAFPSEEFKNLFGNALLEYAQGGFDWEQVTAEVRDAWKSEKAK
jgi:raffinose/stachyose/melibiose transport system substrate-binding protein